MHNPDELKNKHQNHKNIILIPRTLKKVLKTNISYPMDTKTTTTTVPKVLSYLLSLYSGADPGFLERGLICIIVRGGGGGGGFALLILFHF